MDAVASPCIQVCQLDKAAGSCAGCFRTLDEIAVWQTLSEPEKARILDGLPARRATSRLQETADSNR